MQFTPKTEEQLSEESLLPEGEYPFTVIVARDTTSKTSGNPMIELQLEVYDEDGKGRKVTDYLMESMGFKLIHFASTTGLTAEYDRGDMPADIMQGRSGCLRLRIEPASGNFRAKNSVRDYVKATEPAPAAAAPRRPAAPPAGVDPDQPPF